MAAIRQSQSFPGNNLTYLSSLKILSIATRIEIAYFKRFYPYYVIEWRLICGGSNG